MVTANIACFWSQDRIRSKANVTIVLGQGFQVFYLSIYCSLPREVQATSTNRVLCASFVHSRFSRFRHRLNMVFSHVSKEINSTRQTLQSRPYYFHVSSKEDGITCVIRSTRYTNSVYPLYFFCLMRRLTGIIECKARARTIRHSIRRINLCTNLVRQLHPFTCNSI